MMTYRVEFHHADCACNDCDQVPPAFPFTRLTFAAIIVGNAIAFVWDPHGALTALAATIGVQL